MPRGRHYCQVPGNANEPDAIDVATQTGGSGGRFALWVDSSHWPRLLATLEAPLERNDHEVGTLQFETLRCEEQEWQRVLCGLPVHGKDSEWTVPTSVDHGKSLVPARDKLSSMWEDRV